MSVEVSSFYRMVEVEEGFKLGSPTLSVVIVLNTLVDNNSEAFVLFRFLNTPNYQNVPEEFTSRVLRKEDFLEYFVPVDPKDLPGLVLCGTCNNRVSPSMGTCPVCKSGL